MVSQIIWPHPSIAYITSKLAPNSFYSLRNENGIEELHNGWINVTWDHGWVQRLGAGIVDWSHKWFEVTKHTRSQNSLA